MDAADRGGAVCLYLAQHLRNHAAKDRQWQAGDHSNKGELDSHQRQFPHDQPIEADQQPRVEIGDERAGICPGQ